MQKIDDRGAMEYSPLWYSIDTFVPVIKFDMRDAWRPKNASAINYLRLHTVAGWILITFALAALSGLVK
jgi:hypothetical protein